MLPVSTKYHYPILKLLADGKVHTSKEMQDVLIKEFALTEDDLKVKTKGGDKSEGSLLFPKWVGFAIKNLRDASFIITVNKIKGVAQYSITDEGRHFLSLNPEGFNGGTGASLKEKYKKSIEKESTKDDSPQKCESKEGNTKIESSTPSSIGYVYILTNPAFKTFYIKIGYTTNINDRLRELYNTSVPLPFKVYALLKTKKYKQAEKMIHSAFKASRIGNDREFFMLKPDEALEQMKVVAEGLEAVVTIFDENGNEKKTFDFSK